MFVVPSVSFLLGVSSFYIGLYNFGVMMILLIGLFALFGSFVDGEYLGGVVLFFGALGGLVLSTLLLAYTKQVVSVVAISAIIVFTNRKYREWRAKQIALKNLNPF
ncbi:MAG: hypothetical protein WAV25_00545 [Minisyncoccia bacterium]